MISLLGFKFFYNQTIELSVTDFQNSSEEQNLNNLRH